MVAIYPTATDKVARIHTHLAITHAYEVVIIAISIIIFTVGSYVLIT